MFSYTELRDWLLDAGFVAVDGHGDGGMPLTAASRRMIVVARAPGPGPGAAALSGRDRRCHRLPVPEQHLAGDRADERAPGRP